MVKATASSVSLVEKETGYAAAPVYTLTGLRLSDTSLQSLPAGVYIKGGKKVIVRR